MAKNRFRDLGLQIGQLPTGPKNHIVDVPEVWVGHCTKIENAPKTIRTGVTVVLPFQNNIWKEHCFAGYYSLCGHGEMTGMHWVKEGGLLNSGIGLTGSFQVGTVYETLQEFCLPGYGLPVVAETSDAFLNGRQRNLITKSDVLSAMQNASQNETQEGNIGGGTGMVCFQFKGGIGSSSRLIKIEQQTYTLGVLVQANFGLRHQLIINGIAVGEKIGNTVPLPTDISNEKNSIIVIIATDAPLLPHQCERVSARSALGLAKTGCQGQNMSGDLILTFSTGNRIVPNQKIVNHISSINNNEINLLFTAAIEATEEAVLNALCAAETLSGFENRTVSHLPHELIKKYCFQ